MKHAVVTTFHSDGYNNYAQKCIESFIKYWPKEIKLYAVYENVDVKETADNLVILDQNQVNPQLQIFKNSFKDNPFANGIDPKKQNKNPSYLWDAVRFSNKVFAITGIRNFIDSDVDQLIWLDADTVTHATIPIEFINGISPQGNQLTAYLNRPIYPECGWVGYNMRHPMINDFLNRFENVYSSGEFLNMIESHDSYVFWQIMKEFESKGCEWLALGDNNNRGHVFINSGLGAYMDHLKGPRKAQGRSKPSDLIRERTEQWWKDLN